MIHIVLHEPEIPQNTGNIVRTCKSTGSVLHLIEPMGFAVQDKKLKRAGLDYWHDMDIRTHENFNSFSQTNRGARLWLLSTHGNIPYHQAEYRDGDYLVFGKETAGLPSVLREQYPGQCLRIPMLKDNRSLNLSNAVAIVLYEALRQNGFMGLL
ncbi:MAG: tRNA (uridine(34)/cytosine(34)/5-carboxymethylaminomethyluridine(34)-2'-O)-methyltransferase TrmL [Oscillospiraceae bacterium]|nr:tRNA (uridine(34)/cytosine(34)/5-carboxymethylaminomethyluridine(34)-2'-O)-methyltransferase TrmL [Oscillospiraceae bacterium]